jgi:hypothetical protein
MYIFSLAIYSVSYLLIDRTSSQASREKSRRVQPTIDRQAGSSRALHSDRGESGDTYDIDVQTWLGFKAPSLSASMRLLDTAESGEAYDAEVEQSSREELRLVSSLNRAQGVDPSHW